MLPNRDPEGNETITLLELVNFTGRHVLEIGCGDGRLTRRYAGHAHSTVGIDLALERLSNAIDNPVTSANGSVNFLQAQAENLPFPAEHFDAAILAWSL